MKLAKLSLAAIVVAGLASSSFAADTLADAFKNGKVSGELKAYYFDKDNGTNSESIFTTGIMLNYKTASFYGLGANFTFQGSSSPFASDNEKDMFAGTMYGPGAVLSEAYISYTIGKTTALVGRMFLDTPLVASSGSRVVKDSFEGAAVINTDLPNTTLIAGYVQKGQDRTDNNGKIGEFTKKFATGSLSYGELPVNAEDGAYTLAAINKSVPGLTLTAAYAYANDIAQLAYAEALYEGKAGEIGYTLGGQFYYNKIDNTLTNLANTLVVSPYADDSITSYALKAGLSYKGINGTIAYSQTSDDDVATAVANGSSTAKGLHRGELVSGLGNGADLLYTDAVISSPGYTRDTQAYLADVNYDVTSAANVGVRYVLADDNYLDAKYSYSAVYGSYKFDGALKGFKLGAEYEKQGKDVDGSDLWVKASYKF
ncbi:OprD family outer membrane porin [Sulfurospirillum oryzae]|uniref:OprD family outer membrane porin n=1 Tax=Sulfurospirillum oryzae TaxID=2976535 RepID=UPI0021E88D4F|nr:OprD family outer membrane porin [Sulfurospirillum oryzae]